MTYKKSLLILVMLTTLLAVGATAIALPDEGDPICPHGNSHGGGGAPIHDGYDGTPATYADGQLVPTPATEIVKSPLEQAAEATHPEAERGPTPCPANIPIEF